MRFRALAAALVALLSLPNAPPALAEVNVERHSSENPMVEVARSTMYGALAGLIVGGAIELAAKDDSGEPLRWGIVGGTMVGLGYGLWWTSHRPSGAMLEYEDGTLRAHAMPTIQGVVTPDGMREAQIRLVAIRF